MAKVIRTDDDKWIFQCPACLECHFTTDSWGFNGNVDQPTFSPSILVRGKERFPTDDEVKRIMSGDDIHLPDRVCHSFVKDGFIQFLSDCTHDLAGQTVEIENW